MGSEMCIRDRHRIVPQHEVRDRRPTAVADEGLRDDREPHEMKGCLLYTSDAADERSSVDLGGRRIIKKTKHRTRTRASRDVTKKQQ